MTLIAITGDVHAHPFQQYATINEKGINSRLQRIVECLDTMMETAINRKCEQFVIAGDLFHARKEVPTTALDMVSEVLKRRSAEIEVILLMGNHDMSTNSDHTSIQALSGMATIIRMPTVYKKVAYLPWTDDQKYVGKTIAKLREQGGKCLVGHLGIDGAKLGPANIEIPGHIDLDQIGGIDDFLWVSLSHYHKFQKTRKNAWYIGSPLQHTWGEASEIKGFFIADTAKREPEFIENDYSPKFVKLEAKADLKRVRAIDYVKILGKTEADIHELRESLAPKIKDDEESMVTSEITATPEIKERLKLDSANEQQMLQTYVDHRGLPEGLKEEKLLEIGLTLLQGTDE
jgi:DNA repair exonuclease SbcCD nuclease subunit